MKSSAKRSAAKRSPQQAYTRLVVSDALRSWVVPTVAIAASVIVYLAHNLGLIDSGPAVTLVGTFVLGLALFWGIREFLAPGSRGIVRWMVAGFIVLWCVAIYLPFYWMLNLGEPVFSSELHRSGAAATVPLHGRGGRYSMIVESHFGPGERNQNRAGTYRITVGHGGTVDQIAEGAFHQDWRNQRVGAGRRSFTVPTLNETTQVVNVIDDPDGHDLNLQLTEMSGPVGDTVKVRLYPERYPPWLVAALGVLTVAVALVVDVYRPSNATTGLLSTLTIGALVAVLTMRGSTMIVPGFPQLVIGALLGAVGGIIGGSILSRLSRPLRKRLLARA